MRAQQNGLGQNIQCPTILAYWIRARTRMGGTVAGMRNRPSIDSIRMLSIYNFEEAHKENRRQFTLSPL